MYLLGLGLRLNKNFKLFVSFYICIVLLKCVNDMLVNFFFGGGVDDILKCILVNIVFLLELCICFIMFVGIIYYGVFCCKEVILKGVKFGFFKGKVVNISEIKIFDDNSFMWEVV